ncbi:MAG: HIT domain-containing protein [Proteobacteria bacterium]|nr:HIT domain-containing protein [Pseudomonadota bacterium]
MTFSLHPDFDGGSAFVADLKLSQVRLHLDARFPWLILIPRVDAVRDLDDLDADHRAMLMDEIVRASAAVRALGEAWGRPVEKTNVAALGNVTPQLHVHVIGRRADDEAWPKPVWGQGAPRAYDASRRLQSLETLRRALAPSS